jgi:subtilisin family serine protease
MVSGFSGAITGDKARAQPSPREEPASNAPSEPKAAKGEILVKPEDDAPGRRLGEVNRANNAEVEERIPEAGIAVVDLPRDLPVQAAVNAYENAPGIEYAEPNFKLFRSATEPDDPRYENLYGLNNTGQTGGTKDSDIDAPEAWDVGTGSQRTITAVIDTGTDINHPDLRGNVWVNRDETAGNNKDDDNNGYVDDANGWDFFNDDKTVYDSSSVDDHGTHISGTIAAQGDNRRGVTGVNWDGRIMPLKFLGPNGGRTSDAVKAINYAVDNGAKISNNSWGGGGRSQSLKDAITRAGNQGHLVVAAAGNGGSDGVGDDNDQNPFYPSSYDNNNIISVAATDSSDRLAGFSNFGSNTVDLGAPGVRILSTVPGNGYGYKSGTSMASPHVAGVAALLESQNPGAGAAELKRSILRNADRVSDLKGKTVTGDRLNAARALGGTNLTLRSGRRVLEFPGKVGFGGKLTSGGEPVVNGKVELLQRPFGAKSFRRVRDGEVTTNPKGRFIIRGVRPRKHTYYRARFSGENQGLERAISGPERVNVRVKVTIRAKESNVKLGRRRGVVGRVLPKHQGPVRLIVRRNGQLIDRQADRLNDNSIYRFVYKPPRLGNYAVSVVRYKDRDHFGNRSAVKRFRVVR